MKYLTRIGLTIITLALIGFAGSVFLADGTAQASQDNPTKPTGKIYIYGESGRYDYVKIQYKGSGTKKCGGNLTDTPSSLKIKKIPATGPLIITCAQTNLSAPSDGYYELSLGTNSKFAASPIQVEVGRYNTFDANTEQATYVHIGSGSPANPVTLGAGDTNDTPSLFNVNVEVTPAVVSGNISARKKYVSGTVKITASPNRELSRAECRGSITADFTTTSPGATTSRTGVSFPLKYVKLRDPGSRSYCLAKLNKKDVLDPGTYAITAHVPQTAFFNAANASAANGVIIQKR